MHAGGLTQADQAFICMQLAESPVAPNWIDGHVSYIEETTGDNIPLSYYTGDKEDRF